MHKGEILHTRARAQVAHNVMLYVNENTYFAYYSKAYLFVIIGIKASSSNN